MAQYSTARFKSHLPTCALDRSKGIANVDYGKEFKDKKTLTLRALKDFGGRSSEGLALEVEYLRKCFEEISSKGVASDRHLQIIKIAVSNVICSVVFRQKIRV